MNSEKLNIEAQLFLDKIFSDINKNKINLNNWEIDHLCYRSSSIESYQNLKSTFSSFATLLSEAKINGRPISTFKLASPIIYKDYIIDLLELPAPKKGKSTVEGFEHFEVVIDQSFEEILTAYPNSIFKKSGMTKLINPELQMTLDSGAIKFHHCSLEYIINIELSDKVMNFLDHSQILKNLSSYRPLLSGTHPLGIITTSSDLDILFQSDNFGVFKKDVLNIFSKNKTIKVYEKKHQDLASLIIDIEDKGFLIQLFCQNKSVYKQQSNLHFLIEGRLLKIFPRIRSKIIKLKENGIKTEPAFGQVFGLSSPYKDLLDLQLKSDKELKSLYQHLC